MAYETILVDKSERIATLTLNRPQILNAFNRQVGAELLSVLQEAEGDDEVRCVIITGAGRGFCSGADVGMWEARIRAQEEATDPSLLVIPATLTENLQSFLMGMTKPVIAAINGVAVGIGATLTLSCDLRTMAESARLAFIFAKRGIAPEFGSTFLLPRLIGPGMAKELCLTGRFVYAKEAQEIGLVNQVYPDDQFLASTRELARSIAANAPLSLTFIKRGLNLSLDSSLKATIEFEHWAYGITHLSEDHKEGARAFREKREPQFRGR